MARSLATYIALPGTTGEAMEHWHDVFGGDAMDDEHDYPVRDTAYSMLYTVDSPTEAEDYIQKLVDAGGSVGMEFEKAPWGDWYGQIFDRFGVMWAFSCEETQQGA